MANAAPALSFHQKNGVLKFDSGKVDLSYLLEFPILSDYCRVMGHGEEKYGRSNYVMHDDVNRITAALLRHLSAFHGGEKIDPDSGINHLAHVIANAAILSIIPTENSNGTSSEESSSKDD